MTRRLFASVSCALLMMLPTALPAETTPMDAETLWDIARPSTVDISPDGSKAVFSLTRYDVEDNSSTSNLYLLDLDSGETTRLTWADENDSQPVFSPDGSAIAFTSGRGNDQSQLFVMRLDGGEPRQVTDLPVSVQAPKWFPDGERIAFSATIIPGYDGDFDALEEMLEEEEESKVTAKVTENRTYRHWDRWLTDGHYPRLFSLDLESEEVTDLMPGSKRHFAMMGGPQYDIAPDGETIAISANSSEPPYERLRYDLFLLSADGSVELENITTDNPGNDGQPVFSPDGTALLYGAQGRTDFYADQVQIMHYDLESGERLALTEPWDRSPGGWQFDEDGQTLYFQAQDEGKVSLFAMGLEDNEVREIHRGGTNSGVRVAGQTLVFSHDTISQPPEIHRIGLDGSDFRQLTDFNQEITDSVDWGRVENVTYPGANGVDIQMWVIYPPDFDESEQWPLLNLLHGGPHGIFGNQFHFRWNAQLFSAPGYVTIMPNFHGSSSFGQEFTESIHGAHADLPFRDSQKAVDFMLSEYDFIDEDRMAAAGGSYGGYLVSWIAGHTDRYAALINHAGVYNLMAQFASDGTYHRVAAYSGAPWDGLEEMNRWNPAMYAENFETPMLIIHGELDYRVPVNHGLEVYGVYKGKGLDARLVYYPDENHWILSPRNSIHWFGEFHDWLDRWLGADESG